MKKLLSLILALMMVAAVTVASVPAGAEGVDLADTSAGGVLVVTANGENPTEVQVGNEFLVFIGVYAGEEMLLNGQATLTYDVDYVSYVPYEVTIPGSGSDVEFYSFPEKIRDASLVSNFSSDGHIKYNFTKPRGIEPINDATQLFARFRFKANAAGTTDITHIIQYMVDINERHIYYKSESNPEVNPYVNITIEPSLGRAGDADGNYEVNILDVTNIQRLSAGVNLTSNVNTADVTGDNAISLKDAVVIRKYLAGKPVDADIGSWLFASEANE